MVNGLWDEQEGLSGPGLDPGDSGGMEIKRVKFQQLKEEKGLFPARGIAPAFRAVNLKVSAELGKVELKVRELINLEEGSVLKLNRVADEKVLILVNGTPFAHGEIVVINDRFGVRVTALVDKEGGAEKTPGRGNGDG